MVTGETGSTQPTIGHESSHRRGKAGAAPMTARPSALNDLSNARRHWARSSIGPRRLPRRFRPTLTIAAALIVGTAVTLAGRLEYVCGVTLRLDSEAGVEQADQFRKELWDYAWHHLGDATRRQGPRRWYVDAPAAHLLRLCRTVSDPQAGVAALRDLAGGFLAKLQQERADARTSPSPAEHALTNRQSELQTRWEAAQAQLESLGAELPDGEPREQQRARLAKWQTLRIQFSSAQKQLAQATKEAAQIRSAAPPTHGIVPTTARERALQADSALQQDLRELAVNLAELKRYLLDVWQASAASLDGLSHALGKVYDTTRRFADATLPDPQHRFLERLSTETDSFIASTTTFARVWNAEFAALRQIETNPLDGEQLDIHTRSYRLLKDFLFDGGKHAETLRTCVQEFIDASSQNARQHTLRSDLTRGLATLESVFRRFASAAGQIDPRENFRLDSALRGAHGLRRRTRQRITAIDERLQTKALAEAIRQRAKERTQADEQVATRRAEAEEIIQELVALQDELNVGATLSDQYLRASLTAELATDQMMRTQTDLAWTRKQIDKLASRRIAAQDVDVSFVECGVIDGPINLWHKAGIGGLAALLTLLSVTLCQWWLARRE